MEINSEAYEEYRNTLQSYGVDVDKLDDALIIQWYQRWLKINQLEEDEQAVLLNQDFCVEIQEEVDEPLVEVNYNPDAVLVAQLKDDGESLTQQLQTLTKQYKILEHRQRRLESEFLDFKEVKGWVKKE